MLSAFFLWAAGDIDPIGRQADDARNGTVERTAVDLGSERAAARFLFPPIVLCILLLWIVPMRTSLGGDEAGNWWVVKDGLKQTWERSLGTAVLPEPNRCSIFCCLPRLARSSATVKLRSGLQRFWRCLAQCGCCTAWVYG